METVSYMKRCPVHHYFFSSFQHVRTTRFKYQGLAIAVRSSVRNGLCVFVCFTLHGRTVFVCSTQHGHRSLGLTPAIRSANHSAETQEIPVSQKQGIMCVPKGDKDRYELKNRRHISLSNVSYTIVSACCAQRMKKIPPNLIHADQT